MLALIFTKFQRSTSFYPFQIRKLSSKGDVGFCHWLVSSLDIFLLYPDTGESGFCPQHTVTPFQAWHLKHQSTLKYYFSLIFVEDRYQGPYLSSSGTLVAKGKRETMGTRLYFTILTQLVLFSPFVVTPQLSLFSSDKIELATSKIFYEKKDWLNRTHVQNVVRCAKFQICRRASFCFKEIHGMILSRAPISDFPTSARTTLHDYLPFFYLKLTCPISFRFCLFFVSRLSLVATFSRISRVTFVSSPFRVSWLVSVFSFLTTLSEFSSVSVTFAISLNWNKNTTRDELVFQKCLKRKKSITQGLISVNMQDNNHWQSLPTREELNETHETTDPSDYRTQL